MKIRVLGCHGSEQVALNGSAQSHCCAFLINDTVLIDAGTISAALTLPEQLNIRHICLTHLHFDHVQALPTFADNISYECEASVTLIGLSEVLEGLRGHFFNNIVYPDFFRLPQPHQPVFTPSILRPRHPVQIGDLSITAIPVNHLVPTVGFLIRDGDASVLYSGDTYATQEIWQIASQEPTLKAAFIETSLPDEMSDLAFASKHLTPTLLKQEVSKLNRSDVPLYIYHMKPNHSSQIERQLRDLHLPHLTLLREGQEFTI